MAWIVGLSRFGGDATSAFHYQQIRAMLKTAPDTHKMGRIVIVGGASITHGFAAGLGNVDVISAARTGPGYHDEDYEHGADYVHRCLFRGRHSATWILSLRD